MIKVSFILPVCNVEKYLSQALDSLINQTLKEIEIICVDDCSTDGSLSVLKQYAAKDSRIKVIELKENKGSGNARNLALDIAKGEYIMFLDPDDWYELDASERLYKQITENNNDMVFFNSSRYVEETGETVYASRRLLPFKYIITDKRIKLSEMIVPFIDTVHIWYKIYKKEFLDRYNIRFTEHRLGQDIVFTILSYIHADTISILDECFYHYRSHLGQVTMANADMFFIPMNARKLAYDIVLKTGQDIFINSYLVYYINKSLFWYEKYSQLMPSVKKEFYKQIKEVFLEINSKHNIDDIARYIKYKEFVRVVKYDYFMYQLTRFLKTIFWVEEKGKNRFITIFGKTYKKKKSCLKFTEHIFSITNQDVHKQITILGFKIRKQRKSYKCDLPIDNNKIVFWTNNGSYSCNPKYIAEEIQRQNLPYELVWIVNKNIDRYKDDFPDNIRLVMKNGIDDVKEFMTAKTWVVNERRTSYIKKRQYKRDGQLYIQTFHGSMGIKKTGVDREDFGRFNVYFLKSDSKEIDCLTSNSAWTTDFFKRMFFNNGKILEIGHPRNDIFFKNDVEQRKKVFEKFNISPDKKIIMYAPTLREDRDMTCYSINYDMLRDAVAKKFGGEWLIMVRLHPLMVDMTEEFDMDNPYIINATEYSDMQELLACTDILVTDYSSCAYDFMLTGKPTFIYATDIEKYNDDRGLYYSLLSTPFPVATNNTQMSENIKEFDIEKYKTEVQDFLDIKGCIEDGHASERIVEVIKEHMSN